MRGTRLALAVLAFSVAAHAGGPRFISGPPFFNQRFGAAVGWAQPNLMYFTDPGDLSASVNHAAADALVAAAAGVWNVPVASITIGQGGLLAEHVSGQNAYLDTSGMVFPTDVMSANAVAIPIAVIYDTDGSVTDLLLGSGASEPSGCRQNAVTESVDSFDPAGYILHAIVVLNGRCTGAAPQMQLEMQYQLMRAFGRVLGLAWSQTNDNVFTGSPTPTYAQAMNWPIMHPLDIICGAYAYQCLPSPFQLRDDDIGAMAAVYPIWQNQTPAAGKQVSLANADGLSGTVSFPTGEGMAGVNVLVRRAPYGSDSFEGWYEASAVTGSSFRVAATSPFVDADDSPWASFGLTDRNRLGFYSIAYFPLLANAQSENLAISLEPVNPLYTGAYSLGPYAPGVVAPSGSIATASAKQYQIPAGYDLGQDFTIGDAAGACGNGEDGTAQSPIAAPSTGWWQGLLCGYGHASYVQAGVRPGRSFTIEVTALDAQGLATESKAMPVIGLFAPTDAAGSLPSLGLTQAAFQATTVGTTTISAATGQLTSFWFGIADERGDGRPDYNFQARLFYADNIVPAQLESAGGKVTIAGTGFRAGNAVTVNGLAAKVISVSANAIVVTAPAMAAAKAAQGMPVDVVVSDLTSGARSTMTAALTYGGANLPNTMRVVTAPSGTVYVGDSVTTPFAVQVLAPDGVTPLAGDAVVFTVPSGSARFAICGATTCTVRTDANGMASTLVTPTAAGTVEVQAADDSLAQTASFSALAQTGSLVFTQVLSGNQPIGLESATPLVLVDRTANGQGNAGRTVTLSITAGAATFSGCVTSVCTVTTDWSGSIANYVTPTGIGPVTIQAADGDVKTITTFTAVSNTDIMTTYQAPNATSYLGDSTGAFLISLTHADGVSPETLAPVTFTASAGVVLYPCVSNVCTVSTGWNGIVGVGVSVQQTGTYTIQASFGAGAQSVTRTATFTVVDHTVVWKILSVPAGIVPVGTVASQPFTVQLLQDGVTPIAGASVTIGGTQGAMKLGACYNGAACRLLTDGNGILSSSVIPWVAGTLTLDAIFQQLIASTSFTAAGVAETMTVVQQPTATVYVGDMVNLAVQVMGPGGLAPLQNDAIFFTIISGPFAFSDWYAANVVRGTDGDGLASEVGVAGGPGTVTIVATDDVVTQTITFLVKQKSVATNTFSVTAQNPQISVAQGATLALALNAVANENGSAAATQAMVWTAGSGWLNPTPNTLTDATGASSVQAVLGPLAAGAKASMTACAWTAVCAEFDATGVPATAFQLSIAGGGQQALTGGAAFSPMVALVQDGAGHAVAAAPVSVYQTVRAMNVACPSQGRCPAAPILATQATVQVSALDGTVTVAPLSVPGVATVTEIAFSSGTQGFATATVSVQP